MVSFRSFVLMILAGSHETIQVAGESCFCDCGIGPRIAFVLETGQAEACDLLSSCTKSRCERVWERRAESGAALVCRAPSCDPPSLPPSDDAGGEFSFSYSEEESQNRETFDAWATVAQGVPVDPEEYCSFYAPEARIEGPESDVVTHSDITAPECVQDIDELFSSSTQQITDSIMKTWITPRDMLMGFTLVWCSLPCAGGEVVCGDPIEGASLLTRFNNAGEIEEQHWFYDSKELMAVECPA